MKRPLTNQIFIFLISMMLFASLAYLVLFQPRTIGMLDNTLLQVFNGISHPKLTMFFITITNIGSPLVMTIITVVFVCLTSYHDRKQLILYLGYYFATSAGGLFLKHLMARARPDHQLLVDTGYSFPSGHTLCVTLFLFLFYHVMRKSYKSSLYSIVALIGVGCFTILVIISRIYLRDHFPTDVLASILLSVGAFSLLNSMEILLRAHPANVSGDRYVFN